MNNLQADGWDLTDLKYVQLTPEQIDTWRLAPGDILFNRTNSKELVGKCEVFNEQGDWVFASYLMRLRLDATRARPRFVCDFLATRAGRLQIDRESRQIIGMSNINAEEIRTLQVPLPSLAEQDHFIAQMDIAREERDKKLREAHMLVQGINDFVLDQIGLMMPPEDERRTYAVFMSELVGERCDALYYAPRYRQVARVLAESEVFQKLLGKLSPDIAGGATPARAEEELYAAAGIKFLRIMNVTPFEILDKDVKYITSEVHDTMLSRSKLIAGDVLMTITGRVGTSAVVTQEILPANINQHIVRIRLDSDQVLPEYLAAYLNSSVGLTMTNRGVTGGTRIAVDYGFIRNLPIPIPERRIQERISEEVARRRTLAIGLRSEAERLWENAKDEFEAALLGPHTASMG
jgi:restriction endonuclease S subunit